MTSMLYAGRKRLLKCLDLSVVCVLLHSVGLAAPITLPAAHTAAMTFVCLRFPATPGVIAQTRIGGGTSGLGVTRVEVRSKTVGRVLGYLAHLSPRGFVWLRADDVLPPLKLYSDNTPFENLPPWAVEVFTDELERELDELARQRTAGASIPHVYMQEWEVLCGKISAPTGALANLRTYAQVDPLLSTAWDQGDPYNLHMPAVSGAPNGYAGRAPAGCGAIGLAQILRYHQKPAQIVRDETYIDNSGACRGTHAASKAGLTPYDWANMPATITAGSSAAQKIAVAQLIWHCAVALHTDFEAAGSGSTTSMAVNALRNLFGYTCNNYVSRTGFSDQQWFSALSADINASKPVSYLLTSSSGGHFVVCDGVNGTSHIHLNFGWGTFLPSATAWYDMNSIVAANIIWTTQGAIFNITPPAAGVAPSVTFFSINNGAAATASRIVTLNNSCTGSPTEYMASESSSFVGASWQTYSAAPSFTLSSGNGTKTVYFKVRNQYGVSATVSDSITLDEGGYERLFILRMKERII